MTPNGSSSLAQLAALSPAEAEDLPLAVLMGAVDAADDRELAAHPRALLHLARAFEPGQRLSERTATLNRLSELHDAADLVLAREVLAERAIDAARTSELDLAEELARGVLAEVGPDEVVARVRATEALGRLLAWRGDAISAQEANRILTEAADGYRGLGTREWLAQGIFWHGNAVFYQRGELTVALEYMRESLTIFDDHSPRRGVVLTFFADILTMLGEWEQVTDALNEAMALSVTHGDMTTRAYVSWQWARVSSVQGDAAATARWIVETEHHTADWFSTTSGPTFLADAAELLDRVGARDAADGYLARAQAIAPHDEFVLQARAALLARRGDPEEALRALHALTHAPWLEPRLIWRRTLLASYASLRASRDGVETLAARALDQAEALGDARIAVIGEPAIAAALLPFAAAAGSRLAHEFLAPGDTLLVRVLGEVSVHRGGVPVSLPSGLPGMLVRLLAIHPAGLGVEEVIETLWPEENPDVTRRRLRDAMARLRGKASDVVRRQGNRLQLAPAWIDASAFRVAADRALTSRGQDAGALAVSALALWTGDLLPSDPYEAWAATPREQLRRRRLDLLDLIATEAAARGSRDEARLALEQAIETDPYDESRYLAAAEHLTALGRRESARRMLERAVAALRELNVEPPAELRQALREATISA
jgi:DNA-binding SARP family transcriptional activator/predicted metal-dependent hydrolase